MAKEEKVELEHNGTVTEYPIAQALKMLKKQQTKGLKLFKVVGNHKFDGKDITRIKGKGSKKQDEGTTGE